MGSQPGFHPQGTHVSTSMRWSFIWFAGCFRLMFSALLSKHGINWRFIFSHTGLERNCDHICRLHICNFLIVPHFPRFSALLFPHIYAAFTCTFCYFCHMFFTFWYFPHICTDIQRTYRGPVPIQNSDDLFLLISWFFWENGTILERMVSKTPQFPL